jgi:hypothetical protein
MAQFLPTWQHAATLVGIFVAYGLLRAIYRVTFHPLAKFPGPRLAALTYKYEFYYDGIQNGQYTNQISRLHAEYGTHTALRLEEAPDLELIPIHRTNHSHQP